MCDDRSNSLTLTRSRRPRRSSSLCTDTLLDQLLRPPSAAFCNASRPAGHQRWPSHMLNTRQQGQAPVHAHAGC